MSNDAISRQEALDEWNRLSERGRTEFDQVLMMLPSAQPEIVRCKECMNHGKEICYFWSRFYGTINTPDDGFCHKAERRTDG